MTKAHVSHGGAEDSAVQVNQPWHVTRWGWVLPITVLLALIYGGVINGGFVWDDDAHVTIESLRSADGLARIWFDVGATQQYYPLLHSLFWLEHQLWGDAPTGYHIVNLLLHGTAAVLLGLTLQRLGARGGWLAALIFAVHPVNVETAAWISEQKNTLSTVLYLAAALGYLHFNGTRSRLSYLLASAFFVLALLAKSVTATLPAALLVVFWWQRGRLSWTRDVRPLIPWFIAGAVAGLFTAWVERALIGAEGAVYELGPIDRLLLAGRVVWFYFGKLIWPANLSFVYPRWTIVAGRALDWIPLLSAIALLVVLWLWRTRTRAPLAAVLYFGGTLFPVLGFLNVYPFRFSFVADHFQYVASFGIVALAAAGLDCVGQALGRSRNLVAFAAVAALGVLARQQAAMYRDAETLWRTTIVRNPSGPMPWLNLGAYLLKSGRPAEAVPALERARELQPDYAEAYSNLGMAEMLFGRFESAVPLLRRSLELRPRDVQAHDNLGVALRRLNQVDESIAHHREALRLQPDHLAANNNLGCALLDSGRPAEALAHFDFVLRRRPNDPDLHHNRGNALRMLHRLPEAIASYEEALRLDPKLVETRHELGAALMSMGRPADAVPHLEAAVQARPKDPKLHTQLGLALAQSGRVGEALEHFDAALKTAPGDVEAELNRGIALTALDRWDEARESFARVVAQRPDFAEGHRNLAMALANTGALQEAVSHFEAALRLAPESAATHDALSRVLRVLGRASEAEQHRARAEALSGAAR